MSAGIPVIEVRRAVAGDLPFIVECQRSMAMETEGLRLSRNTVTRGVRAVLDEPSRGFYLMAESGSGPVGQLLVTHEWSDWRAGDFWWIQSVYVLPSWRRKGVLRTLFEHLRTESAGRDDVVGLRLYASPRNRTALAAYERLGMRSGRYLVLDMEKR